MTGAFPPELDQRHANDDRESPPHGHRPSDDRDYSPHEHRPLRGYLTVMSIYAAGTAAAVIAARRTGARIPPRLSLSDIAVLGAATHRLSRTIGKDAVASPFRAPFVQYEGPAGEAELNERPRGDGLRHSVGELISCPFCLAVWVSTGLTAGIVLAPRLTRLVAGAASAAAVADFLHLAYDAAKQLAERD